MFRWPQIEIQGSAKLPLLWEFCFCCCLPLPPELAAAFLQSKPGIGNLTEPCIQYLRNTAVNLSSFFPISILVITDQCSFLPAQNIEWSVDHIQKILMDKIRTNLRHGQLFDKYWTHYYFPSQSWVQDKFVQYLYINCPTTKLWQGLDMDKSSTNIGQELDKCRIFVQYLSITCPDTHSIPAPDFVMSLYLSSSDKL